ncbi:MAG: bifunctional phosphoribosylaminoimidazolecarboxamide formyltransferase/IMP cyclohydrolase [Bacteroidia bacterium]|nr:bifunctional phosphoribosylaminoimidazolecarboxamide formyltransferase/IMP cyclohydrolase [Bacteroidia bacterium]
MEIPFRSALLSVYHKDGLDRIAEGLHRLGVQLYASGGTYDFIRNMGLEVTAVEDITGYPSILGGRVKTLHPGVFGGILAKRNDEQHRLDMQKHELPFIDLVVVDLYPFEETVKSGGSAEAIIEKIDIGGISLIRGAAKNFNDVLIIPSVEDYGFLLDIIDNQLGKTNLEQRRQLAVRAFAVSSRYDSAIHQWFELGQLEADTPKIPSSWSSRSLRYGENPHQQAAFHGKPEEVFTQLHGKELSYNNLLDVDAALSLMADFDESSIAIIKHNNACGMASDPDLFKAWEKALAGDPVSAFGGILVSNRVITLPVAEAMNALFFEVLLAPAYDAGALEVLQSKKNRMILKTKEFAPVRKQYRTILNGLLEQDPDRAQETKADLKCVTDKKPSNAELEDLLFANRLVKHSKSNAIVLAKNAQMLASGVGQTSRVDALRQAIAKAQHFGFPLEGAVMASDAFFPFPDCVEIAHAAGISAVVQPGGSVRDQDSVDAANRLGLSMVLTGIRHFKH